MEMKQLVTLTPNRVLDTRKKSKAMNIIDNRTNSQIQLITSVQNSQHKIHHPTLQLVELACEARVKTDRRSYDWITATNKNTGTGWAEQRIKHSPFSANFAGVSNMYTRQQYRTPYSCAEPKALAKAINNVRSESTDPIREATISPAKVVAVEKGDSPRIKVGDIFNRCLNCQQWAGTGNSQATIQALPTTFHYIGSQRRREF